MKKTLEEQLYATSYTGGKQEIVENKENNQEPEAKYFDGQEFRDMFPKAKFFNVVSQRNIGKTTWMLKQLEIISKDIIDAYDPISKQTTRKCKEMLIVRRSDEEMMELKRSLKVRLMNMDMLLKGNIIIANGMIIGRLCSLSTAYNLSSNEYPFIYNVFVDEVISRRNTRFNKNEMKQFLDFLITIERNKVGFECWLFANKITKHCPTITYFNWYPNEDEMFNVLSDGKIVLINVINGYYKIPNIKQTLSYELAQYDESIRSYAYDNITIEEGDELVDDPNNYEITGIKQFYQIDGYLMHMYNSTTKIVACDTLIGEGMKNYIALTRTDTLKYANLKLYDDAKHIAEYFQMLIIRKAIIFNSLELYDVVSNFIVKVLGNIKK